MTKQNAAHVKVLKLSETHDDARGEPSDHMAMFRIWTLLTGGAQLRDHTVANRILR